MYRRTITAIAVALAAAGAHAQDAERQRDGATNEDNGIVAGFFDTADGSKINFSEFKLPPLSELFANARTNPSVEMIAREEEIQRELIKKEKRSLLEYISVHANYTYGIMDNYGSNSTVTSPIYYQYMGSKQSYWNVGARFHMQLDEGFDYRGRIRRQKLAAEKVRMEKEKAFEELKQKIASLYVSITNKIIALKTAGENAAAYKGAGMLTDQEFKMGDVTVRDLAETKRWENEAVGNYQTLQAQIEQDILILEIITNTPIITNAAADVHVDSGN